MTTKKEKNNPERHENAVIVFIKNPVLGKVKTRLAKSVGEEEALRIYRLLLYHTRKIVSEVSAMRYIYYDSAIENDKWSELDFNKRVQVGEDLGERMMNAFTDVLKQHSKVVIVGSDCSQLSSGHIQAAMQSLSTHDIVLGPTFDGGYYLIGMKEVHQNLFQNMTWSVDDVYEETVHRIKLTGLSHDNLPKLSDIDTIDDWARYGIE